MTTQVWFSALSTFIKENEVTPREEIIALLTAEGFRKLHDGSWEVLSWIVAFNPRPQKSYIIAEATKTEFAIPLELAFVLNETERHTVRAFGYAGGMDNAMIRSFANGQLHQGRVNTYHIEYGDSHRPFVRWLDTVRQVST